MTDKPVATRPVASALSSSATLGALLGLALIGCAPDALTFDARGASGQGGSAGTTGGSGAAGGGGTGAVAGSGGSTEVAAWSKMFGGDDGDLGNVVSRVVLGGDGTAYIVGSFAGTADFGDGPRRASGETDGFLAAYDARGVLRWAPTLVGGTGDDYASRVIQKSDDRLVISGAFSGVVGFETGAFTSGGSTDGFIAEYDAITGRNLQSTQIAKGPGSCVAGGLAADGVDVVATVGFQGNASIGSNLDSRGYWDFALLNLSAGTLGAVTQYGTTLSEQIWDVVLGSEGARFLGGWYEQGDLGTGPLPGGGSRNALVMRVAADGAVGWTFGLASAGWDDLTGLVLDEATNTLVASFVVSGPATASGGQTLGFQGGTADGMLIGINAETGALRWSRALAGPRGDALIGLAKTADGVVVGGAADQDSMFNGAALGLSGLSLVALEVGWDGGFLNAMGMRIDGDVRHATVAWRDGRLLLGGEFTGTLETPSGPLSAPSSRAFLVSLPNPWGAE